MKVQFDAFPKLDNGNDDAGKDITSLTGDRLGNLSRVIEWRMRGWRADGGYLPTITGYLVSLFGEDSQYEVEFKTLGEATSYVRKYYAKRVDTAIGPVATAEVLARAEVLREEYKRARRAKWCAECAESLAAAKLRASA